MQKRGETVMELHYQFSSMTEHLLHKFGEKHLYEVWSALGMYKGADRLTDELGFWVTSSVVKYLSYKFNWQRKVTNKNLPIYKAILRGTQDCEYYRHIIFE